MSSSSYAARARRRDSREGSLDGPVGRHEPRLVADSPQHMTSVYVHDFAGHPFQAELSRRLAEAGHVVQHTYALEYQSGKGNFADDTNVTYRAISAGRPLEKYSFGKRAVYESRFAASLIRDMQAQEIDVAILSNVPLVVLSAVSRYLRRTGIPWILWHQDIYSAGMGSELDRRLPSAIATPLKAALRRSERASAMRAAAVVAIGSGFVPWYEDCGIPSDKCCVIPNWAPLTEIGPRARDNEWATKNSLPDQGLRLLYSGTLGRKHRPSLLVELIDQLRSRGVDATLVVVSEGVGADEIKESSHPDVRVLPFQSSQDLPDVLASGDILIALLEPDAAQFSIPSKVLSYLAAGRPVLGLMPADNPAAFDISECRGHVVPPTPQGVARAADWVASLSPDERAEAGRAARLYAEQHFAVESKVRQFSALIESVRTRPTGVRASLDDAGLISARSRRRGRSGVRTAGGTA